MLSNYTNHVIFKMVFPDCGGKDFGMWFWNAENISGSPKHNLLCSHEHKK